MSDLETILRAHAFARGLEPAHQQRLARCASQAAFGPGAFLLREGEPAEALYLVHEGSVSLELHEPGRGTRRIATLAPGDVAGLSWVVPPFRWQLDARAIEPVQAVALAGPCVRAAMEADPAFGYAVLQRMLLLAYDRLHLARLHGLDLFRTGP